jgi:DNA-binding response OmpR family regulator
MRVLVVHSDTTIVPWVQEHLRFDAHTLWDDQCVARLDSQSIQPSNHTIVMAHTKTVDRNALRYVSSLRLDGYRLAVVMIADTATESDIVAAIDAGADECCTRSVAAPVLAAHVRVVLRRIGAPRTLPSAPAIGDVTIDRCAGRIVGTRGEASLTRKDLGLLTTLLESDAYAFSRDELLKRVWGYTFDPGTSVFDVALSRLRTKLNSVSDRVRVVAHRGYGYRLVDLQVASGAMSRAPSVEVHVSS